MRIVIELKDDSESKFLSWRSNEMKLDGDKVLRLSAKDEWMYIKEVELPYDSIQILDY